LNKGIKYLSNANLVLAFLLMIFVLFLGPTTYIMKFFTTTLGTYIQNLPSMSLRMTPFNEGNSDWILDLTIFDLSCWIGLTHFVITFIALVSHGRLILEFVSVVLLVPTIFVVLWFTVFGVTGINLVYLQRANLIDDINNFVSESALF